MTSKKTQVRELLEKIILNSLDVICRGVRGSIFVGNLLLGLGITINARKEYSLGGVVIDQEHERMITFEFGGFCWTCRTETEHNGGCCGRTALLINLDFGHMFGIAKH